MFKTNTEGGKGEVVRLIEAVRDRLGGQHDGKVSPIVHSKTPPTRITQYGKTWMPVLTIVDWMSLDGPAGAGRASRRHPQQRRRRLSSRVAGASAE